jgi:hypothetical protein
MIFGLVGVLLIFATSCIVFGSSCNILNEGKELLRQLNSGVVRDASNGLIIAPSGWTASLCCHKTYHLQRSRGEGSGQWRYKYRSMSAPRPQMSFILEETMKDGV